MKMMQSFRIQTSTFIKIQREIVHHKSRNLIVDIDHQMNNETKYWTKSTKNKKLKKNGRSVFYSKTTNLSVVNYNKKLSPR